MAKSKIVEKRSLSVDGILNLDNNGINIEVEELGSKSLAKLFNDFNGQAVKISISLSSDIED